MRRILIVGATSAIAQEVARRFASAGDSLFLVARSGEKLDAAARDLRVRGAAKVACSVIDVNDFDKHEPLVQEATEALDGLDGVLIAHGTLPDQKACEADYAVAEQELKTNFLSVISLLTPIANQFEAQRGGFIAVISSVAGDRGRGSNYLYGAAKGGVSLFLQGLRNRLEGAGVSVITIKPGFVDTPMTADIEKNALFAQPERVAAGIVKAVEQGREIVYLPPFWRAVMLLIRAVPEPLFKRLKL